MDDTVIGDGVKLDNQIQIGHNCRDRRAHGDGRLRRASPAAPRVGSRCMIGAGARDPRASLDLRRRARVGRHRDLALDPQARHLHRAVSRRGARVLGAQCRGRASPGGAREARAGARKAAANARRRPMAEMDIHEVLDVPAAALPGADDRPGAGVRARQAHPRAEERLGERTLFPGPFSEPPGDAGGADPGSHGAGGGDPRVPHARQQARRKDDLLLRRHRQRALQAAGGARRPAARSRSSCRDRSAASGNSAARVRVGETLVSEADIMCATGRLPGAGG